jgi:hypothetical protein
MSTAMGVTGFAELTLQARDPDGLALLCQGVRDDDRDLA